MANLVVEDGIEYIRKNRYNGSDNKFHCEHGNGRNRIFSGDEQWRDNEADTSAETLEHSEDAVGFINFFVEIAANQSERFCLNGCILQGETDGSSIHDKIILKIVANKRKN